MEISSIYRDFPTQADCIKYIEAKLWPDGPICPYCESKNQSPLPKENRYHCNTCKTTFSVTVHTIFHKTKCDLQKWFVAIYIISNSKKGISARQLAREINVTKDTAWFMLMRIRKAFKEDSYPLEGIIRQTE